MVQLEATRLTFDDENDEPEPIPFDKYHPLRQPPPPTTEEEEAADKAAWDQLERLWLS